MKRHMVVKVLSKAMHIGDVGIFVGNGICKEAYNYHRPGNLYLQEYEGALGLALGMAMNTERRVFVFCDDEYLLRNFNEIIHIGVSKCTNIFIIMLVSGIHTNFGKHPTIFNSIMAPQAVLFNLGFIVHNYKRHFSNMRSPIKEINAIWNKVRGPLAVVIEVEISTKAIQTDVPTEKESLEEIKKFINDENFPPYNYVLPEGVKNLFGEEI